MFGSESSIFDVFMWKYDGKQIRGVNISEQIRIYIYIHIYIYIQRERERDGERETHTHTHTQTQHVIYIYIYRERERERQIDKILILILNILPKTSNFPPKHPPTPPTTPPNNSPDHPPSFYHKIFDLPPQKHIFIKKPTFSRTYIKSDIKIKSSTPKTYRIHSKT